ncbi:hypothetical protein AYO40_06155 [Planctomycetaceae bacterium SCGC AG-212-D15]|nr:hypothetical protein AYO40_06155 [Planctomycetaceae bacterium SCGC AG-212-D15]
MPGNESSAPQDRAVEALIDRLAEVAEPGFGYSVSFSGSEFLPYEETGQMTTLILGAARPTRSDALREIVRRGAPAVPILLKHIKDDRPTKMQPVSGMMWMDFSDEYDFNRRSRTTAPEGVNRHDFGSEKDHPTKHTITVGDLCFVALGQIVNRRFSATRYQPTGGLIVSSPTYSEALSRAILEDWRTLSAESHKRLLIQDFLEPDHESRRTGAYLRLAFYYPDTVEALVVNELSKPTFDVFVIEEFCRKNLYMIEGKDERKTAYQRFLQKHGEAFAPGVLQQLYDDLDSEDRFGSRPRELLIQLFGQPARLTVADRPALDLVSHTQRARLIATLVHDDSRKVGDVVKSLFLKNSNDDDLAPSCLRCLASRGYGDFLLEQLAKITPADSEGKSLHTKYIEAISTSKAVPVRAKLLDILRLTANEEYFMAALPAIDRTQDRLIADAAYKLLARLPEDSKAGQGLLRMVGERFPNEAKTVYRSFLSTGSANRAETMCCVLWYGHPLAKEILAPLLDDRRELTGFSIPMRVCDRAAQAISHASKDIRFDSDWSRKKKDEQIEKLKQYCKEGAR